VDTGIRRDHPDLSPTGGRNCVYGEDESLWYEDEDGHGSHCAGIIAAAANNTGVKGYAPQAQIYAYRVFAKDGAGATTYDIAKAIQSAVEDGCDIISLSLGACPRISETSMLVVPPDGHAHGMRTALGKPAAAPEKLRHLPKGHHSLLRGAPPRTSPCAVHTRSAKA
jgi:subtilisin family serine protease